VKNNPVFSMGRLDYDYQHEPIMYGWKKSHKFYGKGQFKKSIWEIIRDKEKLHPTMKPLELISNCLLNSSEAKQITLDLFLGSGSTLIACEQLNRICYGMEIDPIYCDVVIRRWEDYTGKKAVKL
jgi:DNA modification methylase